MSDVWLYVPDLVREGWLTVLGAGGRAPDRTPEEVVASLFTALGGVGFELAPDSGMRYHDAQGRFRVADLLADLTESTPLPMSCDDLAAAAGYAAALFGSRDVALRSWERVGGYLFDVRQSLDPLGTTGPSDFSFGHHTVTALGSSVLDACFAESLVLKETSEYASWMFPALVPEQESCWSLPRPSAGRSRGDKATQAALFLPSADDPELWFEGSAGDTIWAAVYVERWWQARWILFFVGRLGWSVTESQSDFGVHIILTAPHDERDGLSPRREEFHAKRVGKGQWVVLHRLQGASAPPTELDGEFALGRFDDMVKPPPAN